MLHTAVFCRLPLSVMLGCQTTGIPTFTDLVGTETCPPYRAEITRSRSPFSVTSSSMVTTSCLCGSVITLTRIFIPTSKSKKPHPSCEGRGFDYLKHLGGHRNVPTLPGYRAHPIKGGAVRCYVRRCFAVCRSRFCWVASKPTYAVQRLPIWWAQKRCPPYRACWIVE